MWVGGAPARRAGGVGGGSGSGAPASVSVSPRLGVRVCRARGPRPRRAPGPCLVLRPCLRGSAYSLGLSVQYVPLVVPYQLAPRQSGSNGPSTPSYEVEPSVRLACGLRRRGRAASARRPRRTRRRPVRAADRRAGAGDCRGWIRRRSCRGPAVGPPVDAPEPADPVLPARAAPPGDAAPPVDAPPARALLRCGPRPGTGPAPPPAGRGPAAALAPAHRTPAASRRPGPGPRPTAAAGPPVDAARRPVQPTGQLLVGRLDGQEPRHVLLARRVRVVDLGQPPVGALDLVDRGAAGQPERAVRVGSMAIGSMVARGRRSGAWPASRQPMSSPTGASSKSAMVSAPSRPCGS